MDLDSFIKDLFDDLEDVRDEYRFRYIKKRLERISNDHDREAAEIAVSQAMSSGTASFSRPKTVVLMIHGIRTQGVWHYLLKDMLEDNSEVEAVPISFGFYNFVAFILPFLFKSWCKAKVEREIRGALSEHKGKKVVVVAHSFGTYLLSEIMKKNPDLVFDRVVLSGAIVNENFCWDELVNFPKGRIINDCGFRDIYPVLAKAGNPMYGNSGYSGFNSYKIEDRYHDFGHSDFFTEEFMAEFWIPYICDGHVVPSKFSSKREMGLKHYIYEISNIIRGGLLYLAIALVAFLMV